MDRRNGSAAQRPRPTTQIALSSFGMGGFLSNLLVPYANGNRSFFCFGNRWYRRCGLLDQRNRSSRDGAPLCQMCWIFGSFQVVRGRAGSRPNNPATELRCPAITRLVGMDPAEGLVAQRGAAPNFVGNKRVYISVTADNTGWDAR